jgi:hypothetical protein
MAGRGEPKLTDQARAFVVQSLAMFDAPSVVAAAVKQEFGLIVTPQAVEAYDPNKRAGAKLSAKWKALFAATREEFLEGQAKIGISHRVVRLRALERMAARAESMGNLALAKDLLEQAAKEVGDAYTNTRVLRGGLELTTPKTLDDFYGGAQS